MMDETSQLFQNAGSERITAENMALLCSKNVKLDVAPIQIPDITVGELSDMEVVVEAAGSVLGADVTDRPVPPAADSDQPPPPPCGRTVTDDPATTTKNDFTSCGGATLGRTDSTLTDVERQWLARYPALDRHQLAELREAFLVFAVDAAIEMTPRTAAAVANSAQLPIGDIGTCLRAVGQNPTQADIDRITALLPPPPPPAQTEVGTGVSSGLSIRNLQPAAAAPAAAGKQQSTVLSAVTSRLSTETTAPDVRITMDEYLCVMNAYGKLATEEAQVEDLRQAFEVFDDMATGRVSGHRLRAALTSLGERLSDEDVDVMMGLIGDELLDTVDIDYKQLVDKLASV